jgi:hypothetical protein
MECFEGWGATQARSCHADVEPGHEAYISAVVYVLGREMLAYRNRLGGSSSWLRGWHWLDGEIDWMVRLSGRGIMLLGTLRAALHMSLFLEALGVDVR